MAGHLCPWWFAYSFDNPLRRLFHNPERFLGPYLQPGMRCLDLGCGLGFFSLAMARLAGPSGEVISVDLQWQMLRGLQKRAAKAGLDGLIKARRCGADDLGVSDLSASIDFALAFYMVHEVPDPERFLGQAGQTLKPQSCFMLVEPLMHVTASQFRRTLEAARLAGLAVVERPKVRFSHAALLARA